MLRRSRRTAFTLIEVLVVTAIISTLAAILFPVFAAVRNAARTTVCISNMRQIGLALQLYKQDYGELPEHLSTLVPTYISDPRILICPLDPLKGRHAGNPRMEGTLYLPTGVSYDYVPQWHVAHVLGWWNGGPNFGPGKWDDLTPVVDTQWHWATVFNGGWTSNASAAKGWQYVLTLGGSVRRLRVEDPIEDFTPEKYR